MAGHQRSGSGGGLGERRPPAERRTPRPPNLAARLTTRLRQWHFIVSARVSPPLGSPRRINTRESEPLAFNFMPNFFSPSEMDPIPLPWTSPPVVRTTDIREKKGMDPRLGCPPLLADLWDRGKWNLGVSHALSAWSVLTPWVGFIKRLLLATVLFYRDNITRAISLVTQFFWLHLLLLPACPLRPPRIDWDRRWHLHSASQIITLSANRLLEIHAL